MADTVSATFEIAGWDEQPFDEQEGTAKLTLAAVEKTYAGDITGTSVTRWLMAYGEDGSARFVGIERISGTVAGKSGTLVLHHDGGFEGKAARATLTVLSGTGDLTGATGTGDLLADPAGKVTLALG